MNTHAHFRRKNFALLWVIFLTTITLLFVGTFALAEEGSVSTESVITEEVVVEEDVAEEETAEEIVEEIIDEKIVEEVTEEPVIEEIVSSDSIVKEESAPGPSPELSTDKPDYHLYEVATIFGSLFESIQDVALHIFGGTEEDGTYTETFDNVQADANGDFAYEYQLDLIYRPLYTVIARALSGEDLAWTTFTDAPPKISLEQCRNGAVGTPTNCVSGGGGTGWVTGNVGSSQGHYLEGHSIPYRAVLENMPTGVPVTLTLGYDIKHSSAHAIDYLTYFDRLLPHTQFGHLKETITPTSGVSGLSATVGTLAIPAPSSLGSPVTGQPTASFNSLLAAERLMTLYGGTISAISYVSQGSLTAAQSETRISVTFTLDSATAVLAWGGHIATEADWGTGNSAGGISGSPYHMRTIGWTLGSLGNQDRSLSAAVILVPQEGNIIIEKQTLPDGDPQLFTFTPSWGANFNLSDGQQNDSGSLTAGIYSVSESIPAGWELTSATCDDGSPISAIDLSPEETVTCIFTNTKEGSITIEKQTLPDGSGQGFTFNGDVSGSLSDDQTASQDVTPGAYNSTETVPAGWSLTDITCDDGNSSGNTSTGEATFNVEPGEDVTCVFTNTQDGSITVEKTVVGLDDDFDFTGEIITTLGNGESDSVSVAPGQYSVVESANDVYDLTDIFCGDGNSSGDIGDREAIFNVEPGEDVICTFTNSERPTLTLVKILPNDDGGDATQDQFQAYIDDSPVDWDIAYALDPGPHVTSEDELFGYAASDWGDDCSADGTVSLAYGEHKTCEITNDDIAPTLTLVKSVQNNFGGLATENDFQAKIDNSDVDWSVANEVSVGNHTASEIANVSGYTASNWGGGCDTDGSITLSLAQNATCTITNSDIPGEIHGSKFEDVNANGVWDDGEPALVDWQINISDGNGFSDSTLTNDNGDYWFMDLPIGTYTVTETLQDGWTQTTPDPDPIELSLAEVVEDVDFGNFENGSVSGVKFHDLDGDKLAQEDGEPELPGWTIRLYETSGDPWVLVASNVTDGSGAYSFDDLAPGSYKACEVLEGGWVQTFPNIADNNNSPSSSEEGQKCQTVNIDTSGESNTRNLGNYEIQILGVEKTADTSFTRTFGWTIDKSVTPETWDLFNGDTGTSEYTITLTKDDGTDSDWEVSGNISINNPNPDGIGLTAIIESVDDVISNQGAASVDCGVVFPYDLIGGEMLDCTYNASLSDGDDETNTATVTTSGPVLGNSGDADVLFGDPTTLVDDEVNVDDTYDGNTGPFSDNANYNYERVFTCDIDGGTHDNTATIIETNQSDDASVTVNCYALTVEKDADTSLDRTYEWDINKVGSETELTLAPGQMYPVDYDVEVSVLGSTDDNWAVEGEITISNSHPTEDADLTQVVDTLSVDGGATVNCPSLTVPAAGDLVCTYSKGLTSADIQDNTAVATQQNYDYDSEGTPSTSGTTEVQGVAEVNFGGATVTELDGCVTVNDTHTEGPQGVEVCIGESPKLFEYTIDVGPYDSDQCGIEQQIDNTASFITNDNGEIGEDDHMVLVDVACVCSLTQGFWKTHNDSFWGGAPSYDGWLNIGISKELNGFFTTLLPSYPTNGPNVSPFTWFDVFWTPPKGNAYYNLAHQYMAAKLNWENGAWGPSVEDTLLASENLFDEYAPEDLVTFATNKKGKQIGKKNIHEQEVLSEMIEFAEVLGAFNEGETNPAGHCSEPPVVELANI